MQQYCTNVSQDEKYVSCQSESSLDWKGSNNKENIVVTGLIIKLILNVPIAPVTLKPETQWK